jgi:hypothetical protein
MKRCNRRTYNILYQHSRCSTASKRTSRCAVSMTTAIGVASLMLLDVSGLVKMRLVTQLVHHMRVDMSL